MKTILIASKDLLIINKISIILDELGIGYYTLNDFDYDYNIGENGITTMENAFTKAIFYYELIGMPVLATDSALFFDYMDIETQFGLLSAKKLLYDSDGSVIGKQKLSDSENFTRIKQLLISMGGNAWGNFVESFVYINQYGDVSSVDITNKRLLKTPHSLMRRINAPIDSFIYYEDINKFSSELNAEEEYKVNIQSRLLIKEFINSSILMEDKPKINKLMYK